MKTEEEEREKEKRHEDRREMKGWNEEKKLINVETTRKS